MKKFYIEATETTMYKTIVDAKDYHDAQEVFWGICGDLKPKDRNCNIDFIEETQE